MAEQNQLTPANPPPQEQREKARPYVKPRWGFGDYFWFILKNIIGWILILIAWPIGVAIPGPGGIPLFVIGFALITFPGKRRMTARVLCGRPVDRNSRGYRITLAIIALGVPAALMSWAADKWLPFLRERSLWGLQLAIVYACLVTAIWIFGLRGVHIINLGLRVVARARREARPWMRRKGLDLLPPRRRSRLRRPDMPSEPDEGILELHSRHQDRLRRWWDFSRVWLLRILRLAVVAAIVALMLRPVLRKWNDPAVQARIDAINWWYFAIAAVMFSAFLFTFRVLVWRRILIGMGHRLPVRVAMRIWSFSELARYVPGAIWQILGRVYLVRPYGVSAGVSSASHILEITLFVLANIVVALACLAVAGLGLMPEHRLWLLVLVAIVPAILILVHPRVYYGLVNGVLRRLHRPEIEQRLPKRMLGMLAGWNMVGLLWQGIAIWILTSSSLGLPLSKWYVVAGAYCLGWAVGFSMAFLAPSGVGVRELAFATTVQWVLPPEARAQFADPSVLMAVAIFLGVLLRLWAIAGELLMALVGYLADYHGAMGHPNAPGRAIVARAGE